MNDDFANSEVKRLVREINERLDKAGEIKTITEADGGDPVCEPIYDQMRRRFTTNDPTIIRYGTPGDAGAFDPVNLYFWGCG